MAATPIFQSLVASPLNIAGSIFTLILAYNLYQIIYNLYFHPLAKFPGPFLHRISRIPYCVRIIRGTWPFDVLPMHEKYGDFVRLAPDELAISHPDAWKDIGGHKAGGGGEEMAKFEKFYTLNQTEPKQIINADREEHTRLRRQLANQFSEKAMREQEPLIGHYIDLLIKRLGQHSEGGKKAVNMTAWYNFTTFDVIGDLAFGEPFGCLENSKYHPWVKTILESGRIGTLLHSLQFFPTIKTILWYMMPPFILNEVRKGLKLAQDKVERRIQKGDRPDLIQGLLTKREEWNMSITELAANSNVLVVAGSETIASLLDGVTFFLLTNPDCFAKLTAEVRTTFAREEDINLNSITDLKYMLACLDETARLRPAIPIGLPRVVPPSGAVIAGRPIPGSTVVSVFQWASYRRPSHFHQPLSFLPERHLPATRTPWPFDGDKREILQPFSVGPRNCIGRSLAYAEMRLILARVVWRFDMKLEKGCEGWYDRQKVYFFWSKGPLWVRLMERVGI